MANERLAPFRDYDEHDVINLFAWDSASAPTSFAGRIVAGTVVKVKTGFSNTAELSMLGDVGASYDNVVSQRYGVPAEITAAGEADAAPLGLMLFDVSEHDENGELLKFNPSKAAEMQTCVLGQAVPVVTKGIFLINWVGGANQDGSAPTVGGAIYAHAAGYLSADPALGAGGAPSLGKALGELDADGKVLIKLEL